MWVIWNKKKRACLAHQHYKSTYTHSLKHTFVFASRGVAELACGENDVVKDLSWARDRGRRGKIA